MALLVADWRYAFPLWRSCGRRRQAEADRTRTTRRACTRARWHSAQAYGRSGPLLPRLAVGDPSVRHRIRDDPSLMSSSRRTRKPDHARLAWHRPPPHRGRRRRVLSAPCPGAHQGAPCAYRAHGPWRTQRHQGRRSAYPPGTHRSGTRQSRSDAQWHIPPRATRAGQTRKRA